MLLPITENARRIELPDQSEFKVIDQNQDSIIVLGYEVNTKGEPSKKLWENMLKKIRDKLGKISEQQPNGGPSDEIQVAPLKQQITVVHQKKFSQLPHR